MPTVQDIMTTDLSTLPLTAPVRQAARMMRDEDIGDVLVVNDEGAIVGLVTDRDIAVRAIAEGRDPEATRIGEICSADLVVARPEQEVDDVVRLMREQAVRRIPVVDGDRAVGIISLGDVAVEREPFSTLAEISAEEPDD